jgi:hypothetical protein
MRYFLTAPNCHETITFFYIYCLANVLKYHLKGRYEKEQAFESFSQ